MNNKSECCGCTACQQICPPQCITMHSDEEGFLYPEIDKNACIRCGKCEKHCPQQIHIREELKNVKRRMENPAYKVAKVVADKIYKY